MASLLRKDVSATIAPAVVHSGSSAGAGLAPLRVRPVAAPHDAALECASPLAAAVSNRLFVFQTDDFVRCADAETVPYLRQLVQTQAFAR